MSLIKRTGPVDGVWKVWPIRKKEVPAARSLVRPLAWTIWRACSCCWCVRRPLESWSCQYLSLPITLEARREFLEMGRRRLNATYVVMVRRLFYVPSRRAFQSQTLGPLNLSHAERNEEAFAAGVFSSFGRSVSEQRSVQQRRVSRVVVCCTLGSH